MKLKKTSNKQRELKKQRQYTISIFLKKIIPLALVLLDFPCLSASSGNVISNNTRQLWFEMFYHIYVELLTIKSSTVNVAYIFLVYIICFHRQKKTVANYNRTILSFYNYFFFTHSMVDFASFYPLSYRIVTYIIFVVCSIISNHSSQE